MWSVEVNDHNAVQISLLTFRALFVGATLFFEFANPQFNGAGDFPRILIAPLRGQFWLCRPLIPVFDDSDFMIHEL